MRSRGRLEILVFVDNRWTTLGIQRSYRDSEISVQLLESQQQLQRTLKECQAPVVNPWRLQKSANMVLALSGLPVETSENSLSVPGLFYWTSFAM